MTTADRLRELRAAEGLTQMQLAQRLGTSPTTVCQWERGRTVSPAYLRLLRQGWPGYFCDNPRDTGGESAENSGERNLF